jgi:hypothetical protein
MAEITKQIVFLGGTDGLTASATCTYDDVTLDIVRFNLVCAFTVHIILWRVSAQPWRDFVLAPGVYEFLSGGPVQNWADIGAYELARA